MEVSKVWWTNLAILCSILSQVCGNTSALKNQVALPQTPPQKWFILEFPKTHPWFWGQPKKTFKNPPCQTCLGQPKTPNIFGGSTFSHLQLNPPKFSFHLNKSKALREGDPSFKTWLAHLILQRSRQFPRLRNLRGWNFEARWMLREVSLEEMFCLR